PVERADHVVTLARAHRDQPDRAGRARVESGSDVPLHDREPLRQRALRVVVGRVPRDPVLVGRVAQSAFSIDSTSSGAAGTTSGPKRAITLPSRPTRNFSKFQRMSPVWPSPSAVSVRSWYSGCRPAPLTSIFSVSGNVTL